MTVKNMNLKVNNVNYADVPVELANTIAKMLSPYKTTVSTPAPQPKAEPKQAKAKKQTSKKSEGTFDKDKYLAVGKELGVVGKKGMVYKCCRPTVYKVMNGELTVAKAKKECAKIIAEQGWD